MKPIADAVDGEEVTIAGVVAAMGSPLRGPLSDQPCVLYEIYDAFGDDHPRDRATQDFVVRDDDGKARVVATHLETSLLGRARHAQVQAIDADIHDVSAKLSELKDRAAHVQGPEAKKLHAELRRYKRVATLLCAMKAQARGRVHGAMSLSEQARFIERENEALGAADGTVSFGIERIEALLAPGQRVVVTGRGRWEIDSEGGAGYRQAGRVLVLEGEPGAPVRVDLEEGERSRLKAKGAREVAPSDPPDEPSAALAQPTASSLGPWLFLAFVLGMIVYALL